MGAASGPVKGGRRYDASSRRARAAERRSLVLRVAEEMFLRDGYAAVTVRAVADATGTSAETIYKTYGGKAGLVAAIQEAALQGSGPVPAPERSDAMSLREFDADVILGHWATLSMEVAPRVSPVMLLVRSSAATDPQMRELWDRMARERRDRMSHNADRLLATGQVRPDLGRDDVRDVLHTYTSPELYEILVLDSGWSLQAYADFVHRGLRGQLLEAAE
jgi:AcrR family transcriptional regulator